MSDENKVLNKELNSTLDHQEVREKNVSDIQLQEKSTPDELTVIKEKIIKIEQEKNAITSLKQQLQEYYNLVQSTSDDFQAEEKILSISNIKTLLDKEFPDLDLKFSDKTQDEEGISDRDLNFDKILQHLQALDQQLISLEQQKKQMRLESTENQEETCQKELSLKNIFSQVDYPQHIDNFILSDDILKLEDKYDITLLTAELKKELRNKLEQSILNNKSLENKDKLTEISQALIDFKWTESSYLYYKRKNKEAIESLNNDRHDYQEINKFVDQLNSLSAEDKKRSVTITEDFRVEDINAEADSEVDKIKENHIDDKLKNYLHTLIGKYKDKIDRINTNIFIFKNKKHRLKEKQIEIVKYFLDLQKGSTNFDNETAQKYCETSEVAKLNKFYHDKQTIETARQQAIARQNDLNEKLLGIKLKVNYDYALYHQVMPITELITHSKKIALEINDYLNNLPSDKQIVIDKMHYCEQKMQKAITNYENLVAKYKL